MIAPRGASAGDLTLTVERPVAGGRMLARHEGRVVLVAGSLPGERVRARIERAAKGVAFAQTVDVLEASRFRRPAPGDPQCGGLTLAHADYPYQLDLKGQIVADTFRRIGKLSLPAPVLFAPSPERGYRMRARLHVRGRRAGFFREGTRDLCAARPGGQLTDAALDAVEGLLTALGPDVDALDALTIVENVKASERAAHLEPFRTWALPRLGLPAGLTGVSVATGTGVVEIAGSATVVDTAADLGLPSDVAPPAVCWYRSAASFFQGNRHLVGPLVEAVASKAIGDPVVELYAGVGLFSVPLAVRGARVVAIEGDPVSGADLVRNASVTEGRLDARIVEAARGAHALGRFAPEVLVVDPPRIGLSPAALQACLALDAPRVLYVSCDPATLARDAAGLAAAGFELTSVDGFDMFPNTAHIELLAAFTR